MTTALGILALFALAYLAGWVLNVVATAVWWLVIVPAIRQSLRALSWWVRA